MIRVGPNMLSIADKDMIKQVLVKEDMPKGDAYGRIESEIAKLFLLKWSHTPVAGFHQNLFDMTDKGEHKQRVSLKMASSRINFE